ncbi:peptidoglycan editing factor PgeF [Cohnella nanjingensis]|uniref:Purine nucleoside phosphorylase n=1 Tax=Cohnella nanjingensis TaxID=1387779 RepID=A0A7X0VH84_9BACL|nr:peptidoglycan editing factor PgeF [Cohnella nanjingensis]MBB6673208.1 peptidoglycan editing factor PgeF [Cohnella nanjingensis]
MEPFAAQSSTQPEQSQAALLHLAPWASLAGVTAGFTSRRGGVSAAPWQSLNVALHVGDDAEDVIRNRRIVSEALDWPFEAWTCAEQVHGSRVYVVRTEDRGAGRERRASAIQDADALVTDEPNVLLAMYFADCVPLYFYDPRHGALGLAHAGWKGTVLDIASETVRAMAAEYGTDPRELRAAIGPSIGACCYEVDEAVMQRVRPLTAGADGRFYTEGADGKANLDLKEINRHLMIKAGILPSRIEMSTWCTSCRTDVFFSHRRERGRAGRMMSWLGKRN